MLEFCISLFGLHAAGYVLNNAGQFGGPAVAVRDAIAPGGDPANAAVGQLDAELGADVTFRAFDRDL